MEVDRIAGSESHEQVVGADSVSDETIAAAFRPLPPALRVRPFRIATGISYVPMVARDFEAG